MKKSIGIILGLIIFLICINLCNNYKIKILKNRYSQFLMNPMMNKNQGIFLIKKANSMAWTYSRKQSYEIQLLKSRVYFLNKEFDQSLSILNPIHQTSKVEINVFKGIIYELTGDKTKALDLYQQALDVCDKTKAYCFIVEFFLNNDLEKFKEDVKLEDEFFHHFVESMFRSGNYKKDREAFIYHLFIENY